MVRMKKILFLFLASLVLVPAGAQDSIRDLLRVNPDYYCGPYTPYYYMPQNYTPAPRGFRPFFVNHIARHGSRTYISYKVADRLLKELARAREKGCLTTAGLRLEKDLKYLYDYMDGTWGDLTPLGERQHREIARRMFRNFPEVFKGKGRRVDAISTTVPRSMVSMASFMSELKGLNPNIEMSMQSSDRYRPLLAVSGYSDHRAHIAQGAYKQPFEQLARTKSHDRFIASLFKDGGKCLGTDAADFMYDMFSVAMIAPDIDCPVSLLGYFDEQEKFDQWELHSLKEYLVKARSVPAGDVAVSIIKKLLEQMLVSSQAAIDGTAPYDALFRFAHGENTIPLAAVMELDGLGVTEADPAEVYKVWQSFNANPMATNIQWILYRNRKGEVLIKVLYNEREQRLPSLDQSAAPYYRWDDFKRYYTGVKDRLMDLKY